NSEFKPTVLDRNTDTPVVPNGTLGHRFGEEGEGRWNLDLEDIDPVLSLYTEGGPSQEVLLPRFDAPDGKVAHEPRGVPVRQVGEHVVTTVFDLMLAQYGVSRPGLGGTWPTGYDDPTTACTPAWASEITSVPMAKIVRLGREFAQNSEDTKSRSMLQMRASQQHMIQSALIYLASQILTTIT